MESLGDQIQIDLPLWSLPKEAIAVSASWDPSLNIEFVEIQVPKDFDVEDVLNVNEFYFSNSILTLNGIKKTKKEEANFNYVSIIMSSPMQQELKRKYPLIWNFKTKEQEICEKQVEIRVFRPKVEIIEHPKVLTLNDEGFQPKLDLKFKWIGFGDIEVDLEIIAKEDRISEGRSLFEEMIRRIFVIILKGEDIILDQEPTCKDSEEETEIDRDYIQFLVKEILKALREYSKKIETESDVLEILSKWIKKKSVLTEFDDYLASIVETLLLQVLTESVEKNPIDGVRISMPRTEIDTYIFKPIINLVLRIIYSDNMDNKYMSSDVEIPVKDLRSEECRNKPLKEIIDVKNWINASWKNVGRTDDE